MVRRFEKSSSYVELDTFRGFDGPQIATRSGRVGRKPTTEKIDRIAHPKALPATIDKKVARLLGQGFREVPEGGVHAKLARLAMLAEKTDAGAAKKAFDLLRELEAMDRNLRTRFAEAGVDLRIERARFHIRLGEAAFRRQEPRYWARIDRSELPNVVMPIYDYNYAAANRALQSPAARPKAGATAPDYREAARELERAAKLAPGAHDDAPVMLATIALRAKEYATAARWLAPLAKSDDRVPRFLLGIVRLHQQKWAEARALLRSVKRMAVPVLTNLAFAEFSLGNDAKAIDLLGQALVLEPKNGYARFHLQRLARKGQSTNAVAARLRERDRVITIRTPREFYEKIGEIGEALRLRYNIRKAPAPLAKAKIDAIRIAKYRNRTTPTRPLPESAKAMLRYDRSFPLWGAEKREWILGPHLTKARGAVASLDIARIVRSEGLRKMKAANALRKLPLTVPVWNDDATLPACVEIASPGDQRVFLYVGEPDADGELPVARFDPEPCVWITDASLIQLVVRDAIEAGIKIRCSIDFDAALARAIRRNRQHEERWSRHPLVTQALAAEDGQDGTRARRRPKR